MIICNLVSVSSLNYLISFCSFIDLMYFKSIILFIFSFSWSVVNIKLLRVSVISLMILNMFFKSLKSCCSIWIDFDSSLLSDRFSIIFCLLSFACLCERSLSCSLGSNTLIFVKFFLLFDLASIILLLW